MPKQVMFVLLGARYGWPLTVGAVLTVILAQHDNAPFAMIVAVGTAAVTGTIFARVDLPRLRTMRQSS